MHLKEKAKQLPEVPGVYIMKDAEEHIIYIGKAKSLKNRVSQYFQSASRHAPKILRMIEGIRDFDYIFADTELEALLLECRLIKDIKPMYNSQLKNDQKYVYIHINLEDKYPTLEIRAEKKEGGIYFGPYNSVNNVERGVNAIKRNLRLRYCNSLTTKSSGCLNYQLGFCTAPCAGEVAEVEYRQLIREAIDFVKGGKSDLMKDLKGKMLSAAEAFDFDKAAKYRDDIRALRHLVSKQKTIDFTENGRNIIALEEVNEQYYKLFIIKGGHVVYKERLNMMQDQAVLKQHIIDLVLGYKEELKRGEAVELDKGEIDQGQILYSYIKNKKGCNHIAIPKAWLRGRETVKLEQGVQKLVEKLKK